MSSKMCLDFWCCFYLVIVLYITSRRNDLLWLQTSWFYGILIVRHEDIEKVMMLQIKLSVLSKVSIQSALKSKKVKYFGIVFALAFGVLKINYLWK